MNTLTAPLLETPASDDLFARETLGTLDAHDAPSNTDYAFVAYKETHRASGTWCVRIHSLPVMGALFHPNAIRIQARAASAQGRPWFTWGRGLDPSHRDLRKIEFRVHVCDERATAIEIFVRLRRFDHTADDAVSVTIPWPEA